MGARPQGAGRRMRRGEGARGGSPGISPQPVSGLLSGPLDSKVSGRRAAQVFFRSLGEPTSETPSATSGQEPGMRRGKGGDGRGMNPERRANRLERRADRLEHRAAVQKKRIGRMRSEPGGVSDQTSSDSPIQKKVTRGTLGPMRSKRDKQLARAGRLRQKAERLRTGGVTAAEIGQSPQM